ncbi:MAG TPA: hypothetical protein VFG20_16905 [Planctomycetaceae bacterium]|jgi:hypothetical protein|nr:hypothetical protein [Planctomycetaceae bacterium]
MKKKSTSGMSPRVTKSPPIEIADPPPSEGVKDERQRQKTNQVLGPEGGTTEWNGPLSSEDQRRKAP